MIVRILVLLFISFLIYFLFFRKKQKNSSVQHRDNSLDEMVACNACNTFILKNEMIQYQSKYYCSKECIL